MSRHTPISPINSSEKYYLVDVVAFILKYLKDQLYEALSKDNLSQVQFDWVVTVPAIWDIRGKHMMREAAFKVNTSVSPTSQALTVKMRYITSCLTERSAAQIRH